MNRIFLADALPSERFAIRLLLQNLDHMEVVGEAASWPATLALAPTTQANMLVVDWEVLPAEAGSAIAQLRQVCLTKVVVVILPTHAQEAAARLAQADWLINKSHSPTRVAESFRAAAALIDPAQV